MNVIITGAFGAIGSRYVEHARLQGHTVNLFDNGGDRRHVYTRGKLLDCDSLFSSRDIVLWDWHEILLRRFPADIIVHMAAHTGIPHSAETPVEDWEDNVEGTRAILEGMRKAKSKAILVVTSSVKPYRTNVFRHGGIGEDTPLEADEPYAASKAAQSLLVQAYARTYGLRAVVLRCSNLYSDAPCHGPRHGWLTWFSIAAAIGRKVQIQGSGAQTRDMLFQSDVCAAVDACVEHIDKLQGDIYNIGGGMLNEVSILGGLGLVRRFTERPIEHEFGPERPRDDKRFVTDYSKFEAATGWKPKVMMAEGVERVCKWAQANAAELAEVYREVT